MKDNEMHWPKPLLGWKVHCLNTNKESKRSFIEHNQKDKACAWDLQAFPVQEKAHSSSASGWKLFAESIGSPFLLLTRLQCVQKLRFLRAKPE